MFMEYTKSSKEQSENISEIKRKENEAHDC